VSNSVFENKNKTVLLKRASGASKAPTFHEILGYTGCEEEEWGGEGGE